MSRMTRFQAMLEAYGAEPGRWPAQDRAEALALLATSAEAARLREAAAKLDLLLDLAPRPAPARLSAGALAERVTGQTQERVAPYRPSTSWLWVRAAGLAAAAVIGFVVGATQLTGVGDSAATTTPIDVADISPW
jgi:hypothetical protein